MIFGKKVPVFIINGFLESGKTTFVINAIIRDPGIQNERVLIIQCEEGETEYCALPDNIKIHTFEEKEDFTDDALNGLCKKFKPTFVIIEYNGVWGMQKLYDLKLPSNWLTAQQITVIDAQTFETYFSNMKSIFADMLRGSSRVFMNRCTREDDFRLYRNSIKSCAPAADIAYVSDEEGILDIMLEEDLPYSLDDDIITLNPESYMIWYIDMLDNTERYLGKTVEYTGIVAKPGYFSPGSFVVGNEVMTCCEDDMQFLGFVCKYDRIDFLKEGNTVKIQAEIHREYAPEYESEGPVLYVKKSTTIGKKKKKK